MGTRLIKNTSLYWIAFLLLAVLFGTYFRASLLLTYPLVVIGAFYAFGWKLDRNAIYILGWVAVCWLLSFRHGLFLRYNLVSFYFFVPFILLLFAVPPKDGPEINYLKFFMKGLALIVFVNDAFGIIQYILQPGDDSFVGIYGIFTVSQNGLSLLNGLLFFYYLSVFQSTRKVQSLVLPIFFIVCCIMGFYGAGQLVLIGTLLLTYFKIRNKNIIQLLLITCISLGAAILIMRSISPRTLDYNVAIIKRFISPDIHDTPRKMLAFRNYFEAYTAHPIDLFLGSGPGTFNSRSAFMVGSRYYFYVDFIKSSDTPYFFREYAYPLWNNTNTGPYDGFMNQPFSTILALLGEYGLIFFGLLFSSLVVKFIHINKTASRNAKAMALTIESKMYRFCSIFVLLLLVIDNYMEYPEIIGLLLIAIKLSQQQLGKALNV